MKLLGALAILLAMAVLMTGAGGSSGATYVEHDKVTAALAKGGPLVSAANFAVVATVFDCPAAFKASAAESTAPSMSLGATAATKAPSKADRFI